MSMVTSILLVVGGAERGFEADDGTFALDELNRRLAARGHRTGLCPLSRYIVGDKGSPYEEVFGGSFNYLDVNAFLGDLREVYWDNPECVLAVICEEGLDGPYVVTAPGFMRGVG